MLKSEKIRAAAAVIEEQEELALGKYVVKREDGSFCFCAVGALAIAAGLTPNYLTTFNLMDVESVAPSLVETLEAKYGLNFHELRSLQTVNDHAQPRLGNPTRKQVVITWLFNRANEYQGKGE